MYARRQRRERRAGGKELRLTGVGVENYENMGMAKVRKKMEG
jgi:hypothetical protein